LFQVQIENDFFAKKETILIFQELIRQDRQFLPCRYWSLFIFQKADYQ